MLAAQGYYDGTNIRMLDNIEVKPNQKVIITVMDEFLERADCDKTKGIRGILSEYANSDFVKKEKDAWEHALAEKHGAV